MKNSRILLDNGWCTGGSIHEGSIKLVFNCRNRTCCLCDLRTFCCVQEMPRTFSTKPMANVKKLVTPFDIGYAKNIIRYVNQWFLCSFQLVTWALTILLGFFLADPTNLDLKTIFLLAFPYHICCQYSCNLLPKSSMIPLKLSPNVPTMHSETSSTTSSSFAPSPNPPTIQSSTTPPHLLDNVASLNSHGFWW